MKNRLITICISLLSLGFIVNISRSIYTLWQKGSLVVERAQMRDALRQENVQLQNKLSEINSPEFIEKQAREKLNLQREGEVVVVLPQTLGTFSVKDAVTTELSNWQKWWKLFF